MGSVGCFGQIENIKRQSLTYRTGGSPVAVDGKTGIVVERGDIEGLTAAIQQLRITLPIIIRLPRTRRGVLRQGQMFRGVYGVLWEDIAEYLNNLNFVTKG